MANLIEQAKAKADELLQQAYHSAAEKDILPKDADFRGNVDIPKDTKNGDYAANHAMVSAKAMKKAPRQIAEALVAELNLEGCWFVGVEFAGAGFINFRLSQKW